MFQIFIVHVTLNFRMCHLQVSWPRWYQYVIQKIWILTKEYFFCPKKLVRVVRQCCPGGCFLSTGPVYWLWKWQAERWRNRFLKTDCCFLCCYQNASYYYLQTSNTLLQYTNSIMIFEEGTFNHLIAFLLFAFGFGFHFWKKKERNRASINFEFFSNNFFSNEGWLLV